VIGNTLDHGITYMPYGVDFGLPCGMEVVLADGSVMRTGMGAMPGNRSWHVQARPRTDAGPAVHAVGVRDRDQDG
jgi:4-cresol dehydrogenase (hydroxylating) flavoprotein subunit